MPSIDYKLADGTRVPGVTTVLGRFKDSGGLIHWAWQQGKDGKDYRQTRDEAGGAGTEAHALIEARLKLESYVVKGDDDTRAKALACYESYQEWERMHDLSLVSHEEHFVSETFRFGGTPDHIGKIGGKFSLLDIKTANSGPYLDWLGQLGAYMKLWEEQGGERIERAHILRLGKEDASFHHHSYGRETLERGWSYFFLLRQAYDVAAVLKKAC